MGETRKRMKESGGGGGGGGFAAQSRTLPRTNLPHLHHRSHSHPHTFPHFPHHHYLLQQHPQRHPYPAAGDVYITTLNVTPSVHSDFEEDEDERFRHHGLFGSETDTDDGKVTSATHTPSPHHLLNGSNETQTEEDDEATLREILVRYVILFCSQSASRLDVAIMSENLYGPLDGVYVAAFVTKLIIVSVC